MSQTARQALRNQEIADRLFISLHTVKSRPRRYECLRQAGRHSPH
ncbi:hypothetical protein L0337_29225 [candidate division KSB1 bacterium]|nr:hypothetical protein [candidate division KSB1 bacterium]